MLVALVVILGEVHSLQGNGSLDHAVDKHAEVCRQDISFLQGTKVALHVYPH